uniref:Uncharacterized protein n=1 Tax=Ciona intestinalis TaxID=7719 RepID=H2Y0D1_CIOIN
MIRVSRDYVLKVSRLLTTHYIYPICETQFLIQNHNVNIMLL